MRASYLVENHEGKIFAARPKAAKIKTVPSRHISGQPLSLFKNHHRFAHVGVPETFCLRRTDKSDPLPVRGSKWMFHT